jgi:hypothetical protein
MKPYGLLNPRLSKQMGGIVLFCSSDDLLGYFNTGNLHPKK